MRSLNKKGLVGSIAALAVAVGGLGLGAATANAAETSITLNKAQAGHTYVAYKLGDYTSGKPKSDTTLESIGIQKSSAEADAAVTTAAAGIVTFDANETDHVAAVAKQTTSYSEQIRKVAENLAKADLSSITTPAPVSVTTSDAYPATLTMTLPEEGWYFIQDSYIDTSVTPNTPAKGVGILVGTTYKIGDVTYDKLENANGTLEPLGTADAKTDDTSPENPGNPGNADKEYAGSLTAGSTVEFTLTSDVPNYAGLDLDSYVYNYIDTPGVGYDRTSLKLISVTVGADEFVDTDGTLKTGVKLVDPTSAADTKTFTIEFGELFTSLLSQEATPEDPSIDDDAKYEGQQLKVVYTLTALKTATPEQLGNTYDIYDNGHRIPGGTVDPEDPTKTAKTTDGFQKVDPTGKPLAGAAFTMTFGDSTVTVLSGDVDQEGLISDAEKSATTAGDVVFHNVAKLATGEKYTVEETAAPDGYILQKVQLGLWLIDEGTASAADLQAHYSEIDDLFNLATFDADAASSEDSATAKVMNVTSLTQLPLTGAAGVILFVIVAALLAGGSVTMVMISKRNQKAGLAI